VVPRFFVLGFLSKDFFIGSDTLIETNRLYIKFYESEDLADLFNLLTRKELTYPAGFKPVPDLKTCSLSLQYRMMSKQYVKITDKSYNFMGEINFYKDQSKRNPNAYELGFILLEEFQGHGYMQEALKAFIAWFNKQVDIDILTLHMFVGNQKSENTALSLGFQKDGIIRRYKKMYDGEVLDVYTYTMTKPEIERNLKIWQKF
jgi:RimJ/RimL family protein N-acetyltransferase